MPRPIRRRPLTESQRAQVAEHLSLVRRVAASVKRRLPASADMDDLVSSGVIGLTEAVRRYDPLRTDEFRRFAEYRIRGAILDDWRAGDSLSRDMRHLSNEIQDATTGLTGTLGRRPDHAELAEAMQMTSDELASALQKLSGWSVVGLDDAGPALLERTPDPREVDPFALVSYAETLARVDAALLALPDKIRAAAVLRYREGWKLKEIAAAMGYTESRACQVMRVVEAGVRAALAGTGLDEAA